MASQASETFPVSLEKVERDPLVKQMRDFDAAFAHALPADHEQLQWNAYPWQILSHHEGNVAYHTPFDVYLRDGYPVEHLDIGQFDHSQDEVTHQEEVIHPFTCPSFVPRFTTDGSLVVTSNTVETLLCPSASNVFLVNCTSLRKLAPEVHCSGRYEVYNCPQLQRLPAFLKGAELGEELSIHETPIEELPDNLPFRRLIIDKKNTTLRRLPRAIQSRILKEPGDSDYLYFDGPAHLDPRSKPPESATQDFENFGPLNVKVPRSYLEEITSLFDAMFMSLDDIVYDPNVDNFRHSLIPFKHKQMQYRAAIDISNPEKPVLVIPRLAFSLTAPDELPYVHTGEVFMQDVHNLVTISSNVVINNHWSHRAKDSRIHCEHCPSLQSVDCAIEGELDELFFEGCPQLVSLPGYASVEAATFIGCTSLEVLPDFNPDRLRYLRIEDSGITGLPQWIIDKHARNELRFVGDESLLDAPIREEDMHTLQEIHIEAPEMLSLEDFLAHFNEQIANAVVNQIEYDELVGDVEEDIVFASVEMDGKRSLASICSEWQAEIDELCTRIFDFQSIIAAHIPHLDAAEFKLGQIVEPGELAKLFLEKMMKFEDATVVDAIEVWKTYLHQFKLETFDDATADQLRPLCENRDFSGACEVLNIIPGTYEDLAQESFFHLLEQKLDGVPVQIKPFLDQLQRIDETRNSPRVILANAGAGLAGLPFADGFKKAMAVVGIAARAAQKLFTKVWWKQKWAHLLGNVIDD